MRILFICHGNICRSPMAEYIMKELVKREGVAGDWEIESAAVSREEIGNPVYPPARRKLLEQGIPCGQHAARRKLLEQGIPCGQHAARQMTRADYDRFDLLIGMDRSNLRTMQRILRRRSGRKAAFAAGFLPIEKARRSLTRGIPAILMPCGRICWKGVRRC